MVVLSKYDYNLIMRVLTNRQECDIIHKGSCLVHAYKSLPGLVSSNAKYFLPMVALQLLMHIKKLNKKVFLDALKFYVGLVYSGTTVAFMCLSLHCAFRYVIGSFKWATLILMPAICSSAILLVIGTTKAMQLFTTSTFQGAIETFLMHRDNTLTRALFDSVSLQTICFMGCSALILHAKQNELYKGFWFMQPTPKVDREATKCSHESSASCRQYFMKGARMNIFIGLTLDVFRCLTNKSPKHIKGTALVLLWKLRHMKLNMTAFLTSYVLIYRIINCFLLKYNKGSTERKHLLAAFLGGFSYIFYPNISVLVYGMVLSGQITWSMFKSTPNTRFEILKKIPVLWIFFPTSLGYLAQNFIYRNEVSKLSEDMINRLTNNSAKYIMLRIQDELRNARRSYPKLLV